VPVAWLATPEAVLAKVAAAVDQSVMPEVLTGKWRRLERFLNGFYMFNYQF
jgi:hypothetical protein